MCLSKRQKKRRGTVAILVALSLVLLMGVLALLLDGGMLRDNRRQAQTAADMAALAAVTDLFTNSATNQGQDVNGTARQSALANAASNGYNNDGKKNTVAVNLYPSVYQGGAWKGQTIPQGYAEVIVSYKQPAYFSSVWGTTTTQVSARAVARGTWQQASAGIHVLGNSGTTVSTQGSPTVQTDGNMVTNSTDDNARDNGGGNFQANQFFFSDGGSDDDSYRNINTGNSDPNIINHSVPATPDPLAVLPAPSQPRYATTPDGNQASGLNWSGDDSYGAKNGQLTLTPGTYAGGISATSGAVVLQPGVYYLTGSGLSLSGDSSISVAGPNSPDTGSGVLIYYTPGSNGGDGGDGGHYWDQGKASSQPRSWQAMLLVALVGGGGGGGG
ncbi:MAG TPA: pilus assembly protein TadG-related protein [Gemmataceae bacterium]|nr:pilus assembly protein TadG-related protein [Gemmataceae bacterium]